MAKRGHYGRWSESDLLKAVAAYRNGETGLNECSRIYNVPKATIKRHADRKNATANEMKVLGRQSTFTKDMETILANHILQLEECFYGLTIREVRKLAFDVAEKYSIPHTFNKEKKIAGKKWFYSFIRRNPQLSVRKPEGTSMARARGFNRENVDNFFDVFEKTVDKFNFTAESIFNVDESGFTTVQKTLQKVVARKGKRQVGDITTAERGVLTTMPLDVAFFGPLQKYFVQAQEKFLRQYKGDKIYQTQISRLLNEAYGRAATVAIAENAFRAAGIWPVNRHVFQDYQFAASDLLQPQHCGDVTETEVTTGNSAHSSGESDNDSAIVYIPPEKKRKNFEDILQEISPPPTRNPQPGTSSSRARSGIAHKAELLSSTENVQKLKRSAEEKLKKTKKRGKKGQRMQAKNNWFCMICDEEKEEEMIQCLKCHIWVHTICAGIGLSNLLFVGRGDAIIDKNPKLCFVDTVNWTMIGTSLTRYQNNSVNCPQCLDYCKHCWNADTCQEPDTDKCHEECLGCTIHHSSRHCKACKNFKNGDECVADCPKEKYRNTIRSSCLTEQECLSIDPGKWWTFKNECVNACPDQYEVKESGGCKYCGDNCLVICNFTGFIEDVSHEFKGCTYLNGSLEIRLLNKNAAEDLEINLSSLRIIEGYLKIYRSKDITSLMFLKNLREIRGSTLENDHHAIFMYENQNLQKLWEFNDKFNLTIKRGTISFHNNPQLCLSEIQMLANLTGQTGKYSNLDVSPFSNGDKSLCSVIDLNSRVMEITPNNATVVWQTPIDKGVVGYTIFYSNANKNESSSKVIDQCGESEWISVFTSNTSFLIKDLRPFTKYAYYIKVLSSSGGQSEINYFDTLSDDPKIDGNDISAISHNSTAINVTWAMPVSLNGIFAYYQIIVYMEPDWEDFILQRDYCHYKYIDETMKQPVAKKPKFMDNCDCLPPNKPEYMFKMNNVFTMCDPKWSSKYGFDECKSFQYQIDEEDSPTNETFLKGENQMIESRYRVINITDISQTSYMVDNLKHFRIYVFYLQACNQNRTEKPQCSGVIQVSNRTLKNNAADDVFNLEVRRSNLTESTVDVFWKEPEDPNSLIVAYNIEYTNQDVHNNGRVKQCITSRKFKRDSGYRLNLFSGKHVIRVQAVSLAGYGRFSGYYEFYIPHAQKDSSYWVYILCAILLVVVPIVIYLVFRYRHKRLFDNIRLIANINPEYTGVVLEKDDWEIDRENVVIEKSIGEGTFGSVYVGFLKDRNCPCAIKTIKDQVGMREQVEFLNEASVMKSFSNAHHVVKLFGVVSIGHPKLVVMELMDRGDLKRHLRACRDSTSQSITSTDMYKMAIEIADGMAYLAAKKYVHRDLAVRNCMVAADYTVKIGDFGMARDVYQSDYYKKETRGLLPVRWMAPESLIDGVFTSDSDVWSYGIVLWEIATLAEQPYQGLANEQVNNFVSSGGKLDCPNSCPDLLYEIMDSCWQWRPMRRPQFLDIIECLLQHRVQQRLWENFGLVSFYHSKDGLDYRLNHRQRAENPPAMMQGTRMRYRVSDDTVDFDY